MAELVFTAECKRCRKIIIEAEEPRKMFCFLDGTGPFHQACAERILQEDNAFRIFSSPSTSNNECVNGCRCD